MAESFSNSIKRAVGIVTSSTAACTIPAEVSYISGVTTTGISTGNLVVNQHFRAGAKVTGFSTASGYITVDRASTNTANATSQTVTFLGVTTAYSSPAAVKSILIGGTFANFTESNISISVEVSDNSAAGTANSTSLLASEIPIPAGGSFVISDAGKTVLEAEDKVYVYCDTANAVDINLSILKGVS